MTKKIEPWYDDLFDGNDHLAIPRSKHLFDVTIADIQQCWSLLNQIDLDGLRLNPSYINKRNFVVGIFFEVIDYPTCDSNLDQFLVMLFDKFSPHTELFFMPSSDLIKPVNLDEYEAIRYFDPAAIARGPCIPQTFDSVRNSTIKDFTGSYYCFNRDLDFVLLFVSGYYCMVAGQQDVVEGCIGQDYRSSWQTVIERKVDSYKLPSLMQGLNDYRIL